MTIGRTLSFVIWGSELYYVITFQPINREAFLPPPQLQLAMDAFAAPNFYYFFQAETRCLKELYYIFKLKL